MKVAVIYFGIIRSVSQCVESIHEMILKPNMQEGVHFTLFASLNLLDQINNPRSGEISIPVNMSDCFQLKADYYSLSLQRDEAIANELQIARTQNDPHDNGYQSVRNHLHQMNALKQGWNSLKLQTQESFDYYLFLRPDLSYLDKLNIRDLAWRMPNENSILLPTWHSWWGLNDRFALARPAAAERYALKLNGVREFCSFWPLHAESLTAWALSQGGCSVGELPIRAKRVRANSIVLDEDFNAAHRDLPVIAEPFSYQPIALPSINFTPRTEAPFEQDTPAPPPQELSGRALILRWPAQMATKVMMVVKMR